MFRHPFFLLLACLLLAPLSACGPTDDDDSSGDDDDTLGDDDDTLGDDDDSAGDDDTVGDDDSAGDDDDTTDVPSDADNDGHTDDVDCNDEDAGIHPGADEVCDGTDQDCDGDSQAGAIDAPTWYADADGDGFGLQASTEVSCGQPHGYSAYPGDCDDNDPSYHPGAPEVDCTDPNDYNCDSQVNYADSDGDGEAACEDCDDNDIAVNSAATEACNSIDDNCNGQVDEPGASGESTWFLDADGDGYGRSTLSQDACDQPLGYVSNSNDCDDLDPGAYPGGTEVCDGIDNNCDQAIDEGSAAPTAWYADADGDGYGNAAITTTACVAPFGSVANSSDCDDLDATAFPGGTEVCDGVDNNCDQSVDEGLSSTFYSDVDGDGFGDVNAPISACVLAAGASVFSNDCDDGQPTVHPGGVEVCDGLNNDCAGGIDEGFDSDSDGISSCGSDGIPGNSDDDCDDSDTANFPGNPEVCDGGDNDCGGDIDEGFDVDGDSFTTCGADGIAGSSDDDCDDSTSGAAINPGATESCDGIDNNCNSQADEGLLGSSQNCAAASCQAIKDEQAAAPGGSYWLDPDGTGPETEVEVVCDMDVESLAWTDVVATFHQSGADTNDLRDRFFEVTESSWTLDAVPASGANSTNNGILLSITGPSTHSEGFHLVAHGFSHTQVRTDYRMQGSNDNNRCATGNWVPLCGPGYNGGHTTSYLPNCPSGLTCISGSSTLGQDVPISVSYLNDAINPSTELLSWSHSDYGDGSSDGCARDSEIPSTEPATFFTRLLIR